MRSWQAERVAAAAGARLAGPAPVRAGDPGPERVVIDSRTVGPGDLFVGLPGTRADGGAFAASALAAGAWGVLVRPEHGGEARRAAPGAVLTADDPLAALQRLATSWREELGCTVIGITGSTGKTSTKDLLRGMLEPYRRVVATAENLNTEIGLPLTILGAPEETEVLVLEMAMRGSGQIAELAAIARPQIGVVVNVGPVHLELLGSMEAIARAKAELLAALPAGGTAVIPAGEVLLDPHVRDDVVTVTFGPGGDVDELPEHLTLPFGSAHMRLNALAALAAARAVRVEPAGAVRVALSRLRGQRLELARGIVVINDCYNANPMSMRAALDDLAETAHARRVAVLGDMLELGPAEHEFHLRLAEHARAAGVDVLVTVGPRARATAEAFGSGATALGDADAAAGLLPGLLRDGDTVLVKGSRGVGLEVVAEALADAPGVGAGRD
ncbi:MAG TPA: UDP-N-acetylmuramoyl-tripeptide--D-alanyl-D-alanine ligase [Solirubrobacteraceae bacterium]|nr:UDP-N-acetylmuramoyl-tripeptide--D-alanyl-D-alanine ligase [Solirubrobacteraceae bacterium]